MCVFKNHVFIYFLRPPSWSGTRIMKNCLSSRFPIETAAYVWIYRYISRYMLPFQYIYIFICIYIYSENGDVKRKFVFLGGQTINGNRQLLFQQMCLSMSKYLLIWWLWNMPPYSAINWSHISWELGCLGFNNPFPPKFRKRGAW